MSDESGELRNFEAEQAVLGAVMRNNEALEHVGSLLPDHFSDGTHAKIFDAALGLAASGSHISELTLEHQLGDNPGLGELGGIGYLARLATGCPAILAVPDYSRIIVDLAQRRQAQAAIEQLQLAMQTERAKSVAEIIGEAFEDLSGIADDRHGRQTLVTLGEEAGALARRLNQAFMDGSSPEVLIPTGSRDVSRLLGGWRPTQMAVIGGRPGMGKTAAATSLSLRTAMAGNGVLFFSLEMSAARLTKRCVSDLVWRRDDPVPYDSMGRGVLSEQQLKRVLAEEHQLRRLPFLIDDRPGLSVAMMRQKARLAERRLALMGVRLDLIVVDYLGLVRAPVQYQGNRTLETGENIRALHDMAKELSCAILVLVQLNRAVENRGINDRRPNMADLRDSGEIEQDADVVLFAYRHHYYLARDPSATPEALAECEHVLELNIAKNRDGPTGTVTLFCDMASNVVRDAAR